MILRSIERPSQIDSVAICVKRRRDEGRVPKKTALPELTVTTRRQLGSVTVPEARDGTQLTLLTAISVFGDSEYRLFLSKFKAFENALLATQKLYEGHDCTIRLAPRTFITEVLFIDELETILLLHF
jgi:hypothetical protein